MEKCQIIPSSKAVKNMRENEKSLDAAGFDLKAGWFYFYPIDFPVRSYQKRIVEQCLFKNVLVCLPTGLGKTFIAAVIMLNFHRWYPKNLVVFIAPTRPLVHQQYSACVSIGGLRKESVSCMTGVINTTKRLNLYENLRILFTTPQILNNDIAGGALDPKLIKCLIIDEAHKATKNHAYCQLVRAISNIQTDFRIVALTASPGETLDSIQNVITNLNIESIEYYDEDHEEVCGYVKDKRVTEVVLDFEGFFKKLVDSLAGIVNDVLKQCANAKLLSNPDVFKWSSYRIMITINLLKTRGRDRSAAQPLYVAQFLIQAFERLVYHGLIPCLRSLFSSSNFPAPFAISLLKNYPNIYDQLFGIFQKTESNFEGNYPSEDFVHPKIIYMLDVLTAHFKQPECGRVIIFSQYRDSVDEIVAVLTKSSPIFKVMKFIGQSDSKSSKGLKQKQQLEALEKFRNGGYNILVSTSVGEEGLDIGEVKLIIFYDISSSPLRLIQRMGRTGRKEAGKILLLMMKGIEQGSYLKAKNKSKSMTNILTNKISKITFCESSRLFPKEISLICVYSKISCNFNSNTKTDEKQSEFISNFDFNKSLTDFKKPPFDMSVFHIINSIFHSTKAHAIHSIFTRNPKFISQCKINFSGKGLETKNKMPAFDFSDSDFDDIIFDANHSKKQDAYSSINSNNKITKEDLTDLSLISESTRKNESEEIILPRRNKISQTHALFIAEDRSNGDSNEISDFKYKKQKTGLLYGHKDALKEGLNENYGGKGVSGKSGKKVAAKIIDSDSNDIFGGKDIFSNTGKNVSAININCDSNETFGGKDTLNKTGKNFGPKIINSDSNDNFGALNNFIDTGKNFGAKIINSDSNDTFGDINNFIDTGQNFGAKTINSDSNDIFIQHDTDTKNDANSVIEVNYSSDQHSQEKLEESIILRPPKKRTKKLIIETPPKKTKNIGREMLLTQVEVEDTASSDTEISEDDKFEDSFINDDLETSSILVPNSFHRKSLFSPDVEGFNCKNTKYRQWKSVVEGIENKIKAGEYEGSSLIPESSEETTFLTAETEKSPLENSKIDIDVDKSINKENSLTNSIMSDQLIDLNCFKNPAIIPSEITEIVEETIIDDRPVILIESNAILHSQIPSLLRNKYSFELLNFPHLPFNYMIGKTIGIDIIKSSDIVKDQFKIYKCRKYADSSLYSKMYIIIQHDSNDTLDMTQNRMKAIHSLYGSSSPSQTSILYSHSQEKTAFLIADIVSNLEEKQIIQKVNMDAISSTKLMKLASSISRLGIIPPTTVIELLIAFGSFGSFLRDGNPELFKKYSKNIKGVQAHALHQVLERQIFRNNT